MRKKHANNHSQPPPFSFPSAAPSNSLVSTPTAAYTCPTLHSTDLIINILSKLPVKALAKFKSVSKQWLELVSDPYLIAMHGEFSLQNPEILVLKTVTLEKRKTRIDICSVKLDGSFENNMGFSMYLDEDEEGIRLLYSKRGFICFVSENRFYACNASKREMFSLPDVTLCAKGEVNAGIGYVQESNEYVLVHLFHKHVYNDLSCEVLRLRDGGGKDCEWKVMDAKCPYLVKGLGVLVDNVFYWKTKRYYNIIVSFDLVKEEFGSVSPPNNSYPVGWDLVELGGRLCLVDDITCHDIIDIWVMKEDHEWIMEYRIDMREFSTLSTTFDIFDCWNGKIWIWIWVNPKTLGLVYYDVEKGCIIKVDHPTLVNRTWLVLYTGRLFSIVR